MNENSISNWKTIVDKPVNGNSLGRIDQYELIHELGGGGFGTVFLARDTESEVDVAVKGLPPFVKFNREEMENIRSNFRLVHDLHHPHIAAALYLHPAKNVSYASNDVGMKLRVSSGDTLLVMAYAPGVTLSQWRKQFPENKVPLEKAIEITRQIADALDYAHERKVVHRDVKPANVMIETDADGKVTARVLDFGLAAEIRSSMGRVSREITDTSGTRPYMAPEQWLGGKQGPATDQYSLAVLFHELVTGAVPFESVFQTGDPIVMMNVVGREMLEIPADQPKPVRLALAKALSKKMEERFATCGDFVKALEGKIKAKLAGRVVPNAPGGGLRTSRPTVAILALLALLGVGGILWHNSPKPSPVTPPPSVEPVAPTPPDHVLDEKPVVVSDSKPIINPPNPENEILKRKVRELKASVSRMWEQNKVEEWRKWPKFNEYANALDLAMRTADIAFEDKDYAVAQDHYRKVKENWLWLSSNKTVRVEMMKIRDNAYKMKEKFKPVANLVAEYVSTDWSLATNHLDKAEQMHSIGEYANASLMFRRSVNGFETCRQGVLKGVEEAAQLAFLKKKESKQHLMGQLRNHIKSSLSESKGAVALQNANELVKLSHEVQDGDLWVQAWLKAHENDVTESERTKNTASYQDELNRDYCCIEEKHLCTLDFSDAKVMRALGRCFDNSETVLVALAFFRRAKELGLAMDVDKKIIELTERLRVKRYFDPVMTGDIMEIRDVVTRENPRKDIVETDGTTLMHIAAQYGDGRILDYMESIGYRHDIKDKIGRTPFFNACLNTNSIKAVSSMKWFLKKGVDVNAFVTGGYVANCPVMGVRTYEGYEILLKNGARTDVRSKEGKLPIHFWVSSKETSEKLLYRTLDKTNVSERDSKGKTLLHYVSKPSFVQILVSRGADVNAKDNEGKTPLHEAYRGELVKALIACGADVNAKDNEGKTPLHEAYRGELAKALIDCGADVNAKDNEGKTPLFHGYDMERMSILISAGANVNEKDGKGMPLLIKHQYNYEIVDYLLSKGADCNMRLANGNTVFLEFFPCYKNSGVTKKMVSRLLQHVNDVNAKGKDGDTALHKTYDPEVVSMLCGRGADPNVCNDKGEPPLLSLHLESKVAEVLLKHGANPNLKLKKGGTVFTEGFSIFNSDSKEWTRLCVAKGADVNAQNWQNMPLVVAKASHIYFNDLKFLVEECGADVNAVDKDGESALIAAASGYNDSDFEVVKYLVEHGADLFHKYKKRTALEWAGNNKIKEYLKGKMGIGRYRNGNVKTIVLPGGAKMEMIYCEPGSFQMGNKEDRWGWNARPHRVTLTNGFWLGKYEVMQSQWKSVMGNNPSEFKKWLFGSSTNYPVENVDWYDCQEFIKKVNEELSCGARLPTEAEWEYACRAGTDTNYSWGNEPGKDRANYGDSTTQCRISGGTVAVGRYKPNSWGFYDMHGNVGEWCNDWHDSYPLRSKNRINPMGPDKGDQRVVRGGNWFNDAKYCCSWFRAREVPSISCSGINGFRLLCARIPEE